MGGGQANFTIFGVTVDNVRPSELGGMGGNAGVYRGGSTLAAVSASRQILVPGNATDVLGMAHKPLKETQVRL